MKLVRGGMGIINLWKSPLTVLSGEERERDLSLNKEIKSDSACNNLIFTSRNILLSNLSETFIALHSYGAVRSI